MYLIVGLGNPGLEYEDTRHNVGFKVIDEIAKRYNEQSSKVKFNSIYCDINIDGKKVKLIKPLSYMNNSGIPVLEYKNFFKIDPKKIIVIYDDIDIAFGSIRIKKKGSAGTHNGMRSIVYHLQDENFPRVKLSIGQRENKNMSLADFVLSKFLENEKKTIQKEIEVAANAIIDIIKKDIDYAMNEYNNKIC